MVIFWVNNTHFMRCGNGNVRTESLQLYSIHFGVCFCSLNCDFSSFGIYMYTGLDKAVSTVYFEGSVFSFSSLKCLRRCHHQTEPLNLIYLLQLPIEGNRCFCFVYIFKLVFRRAYVKPHLLAPQIAKWQNI